MNNGLHVKYPLFLSDMNGTYIFYKFSKNTQVSNFMKIRSVVVELFRADRRTDMTKLKFVFRNFANASKKGKLPVTSQVGSEDWYRCKHYAY
jgi:hypothetical protein